MVNYNYIQYLVPGQRVEWSSEHGDKLLINVVFGNGHLTISSGVTTTNIILNMEKHENEYNFSKKVVFCSGDDSGPITIVGRVVPKESPAAFKVDQPQIRIDTFRLGVAIYFFVNAFLLLLLIIFTIFSKFENQAVLYSIGLGFSIFFIVMHVLILILYKYFYSFYEKIAEYRFNYVLSLLIFKHKFLYFSVVFALYENQRVL